MALTLVATLGGLLFGYDNCCVNGAENLWFSFILPKLIDPGNLDYAIKIITQYKFMVALAFYLVVLIVSAQILSFWEKQRTINQAQYFWHPYNLGSWLSKS